MKTKKTLGLLLLFILALPALIQADLKDYIMIVKPIYHDKTRELFYDLADQFSKQGQEDLRWYFTNLAEEHGHGTGWIIVDDDGENYIITNMHVVNQADTVNIYFETPDGTQQPYYDCPIVYVDDYMDLAICQFPGGQRVFEVGWELDTEVQRDLTQVISAGFPGFGSQPLWQVATGNISNSRARVDSNYDYWIQHSAPIDPGNSGGPLFIEDPGSELGYKVIGVNTWKASSREATNFAIPAKHVLEVLEKAKKARILETDEDVRRSELERNAKILASELGSEHPQYERVRRYISYAYVGEQGWPALLTSLDVSADPQWWNDYFFEDPLEAMRSAIYWLFWTGLHDRGDISSIEFKEINFADDEEIGKKDHIRTNFMIGDQKTEIVWTLEYGHWKVSNLDLPEFSSSAAATSGATQKKPRSERQSAEIEKGELLYGVRLGLGISSATGSLVDQYYENWPLFSWAVSGFIEYQLAPSFYLHAGLGITQTGFGWTEEIYDLTYFDEWWVFEERIYTLQLPVMIKIYIPGGFFVGVGAALDYAMIKTASFRNSDYNDTQWTLVSNWQEWMLEDIKPINVSVLGSFGMLYNLGSALMGFDVTVDFHLLKDRDYWDWILKSGDLRYLNAHLGVFVLF